MLKLLIIFIKSKFETIKNQQSLRSRQIKKNIKKDLDIKKLTN
jgi:hypothetical protein